MGSFLTLEIEVLKKIFVHNSKMSLAPDGRGDDIRWMRTKTVF